MVTHKIRTGIEKAMKQSRYRSSVRRIALFGSERTGTATAESDVDLLIELQRPIGFFALMDIQTELESVLHRRVDLRTPAELSRYLRQEVLDHAESIYEG